MSHTPDIGPDKSPDISVVVPALNEEAAIRETLLALRREVGASGPVLNIEADIIKVEIIVADGGSSDSTVKIASAIADKVVMGPRGRGVQMNAGAGAASGRILMFVHADCVLPEGVFPLVIKALGGRGVAAGAFDLRIDHDALWARVVERVANLRSRLTRTPYGDQGLFMRREVFKSVGGFPLMALMEDIAMAGRLRSVGRMHFSRARMTASPRRWLSRGVVRTTLWDWALALAYTVFRVSPARLARYYGDVR